MRSRFFIPLVLFSVIQGQTTVATPIGSGTSGDPYLIANLANLSWLSQNSSKWDKYFKQTANIDASTTQYWDDADDDSDGDMYNDTNDGNSTGSDEGFSSIGNSTTKFTGTYDGQNYTISNLYINRSNTWNIGLFGYTNGATIQDLGVGVSITGEYYVGGMVGYNTNSTVSNSYITGSISGYYNVGGMVGNNVNSTVSNSYSTASVSGNQYVGGMVGSNESTIVNCYSLGNVTCITLEYIGAFAGYNGSNSSSIQYCFSTGSVTLSGGTNPTDRGFADYSSTNNSNFWDSEASNQASAYSSATGKTTAEMKTISTFLSAGWDFEIETSNGSNNYWDIDNINGTYNSGYPFLSWQNGNNVSVDLTAPSTPSDLTATHGNAQVILTWSANSENDLASYKVYGGTSTNSTDLLSTISAGTETYTHTGLTNSTTYYYNITAVDNMGNESSATEDVNATPVYLSTPTGSGTEGDPYLIATLDHITWLIQNINEWGKHYQQIADIDASNTQNWDDGDGGDAEGLSPIGNNSTKFTGSYNGDGYIIDGLKIDRISNNYVGLFGYVDGGSISNLGVTNVDIRGGQLGTGGLVGKIINSSTVTNCYSTGSVYGTGNAGGLVGSASTTTVSNSYSTCSVSICSVCYYAGGLVAYDGAGSTISNSYSTGSVSGYYYVGGLVGKIHFSPPSEFYGSGTVSNSYSTGTVEATSYFGGLVGSATASTVSNSFWDMETSNQSSSNGGTGKTSAEMKTASTFTYSGWDFEVETENGTNNYWDMNQDGSHYPVLGWQGDGVLVSDLDAPTNQNSVFASAVSKMGSESVTIISSGTSSNDVWFAPASTTAFTTGGTMTKAVGTATSINAPSTEGTYYLYVIDAVGNYSAASTAALTVDNTAPSIPTDLLATPGNAQVVLTWTAISVSDLASYNVYGGTSVNPTTLLSTISAGTETYTHSNLTNGTTYYYRISAVDNAGNESDKTSDESTTPYIQPVTTQPSGSGTSSDPYLVATLSNLYWVTQNSDRKSVV
jgi:hypothetical protein